MFFLTPHVLQNDLGRGACFADDIVCLVFDEAHKALGNYPYCQVAIILFRAIVCCILTRNCNKCMFYRTAVGLLIFVFVRSEPMDWNFHGFVIFAAWFLVQVNESVLMSIAVSCLKSMQQYC